MGAYLATQAGSFGGKIAISQVSKGLDQKKFHQLFVATGYGKEYCVYLENGIAELATNKKIKTVPKSMLCDDIFNWIWSLNPEDTTAILALPFSPDVEDGLKMLGVDSMQGEYCNQHAQICIIGKIISYHLEIARLQNAPKFEIANGSSDTFAVGAGAVVLTMKTINIALLIIAILLIFMIIINSDLSSVTPSTIVLQNAQLN